MRRETYRGHSSKKENKNLTNPIKLTNAVSRICCLPVRLLYTTSRWRGLARGLGGQLLPGGLASSRLTGGLSNQGKQIERTYIRGRGYRTSDQVCQL